MTKSENTALYMQLQLELQPYLDVMTRAADAIMTKDVSKYPILVVHQQSIELGVPVVDKEKRQTKWSINASTLEEFAMKQVISAEKIEDFQGVYKDANQYLCLFVISELGANFIFIPRSEKSN
ncbi:MAG: hypothetical protein KDC53_06115 [Saprospiraceae bacterium]|nr:hypothetical protein [Saprospiraceae bacterium]